VSKVREPRLYGLDSGPKFRVVITSLTALYAPMWGTNGFPLGYDTHPNWRFEGRMLKEALDADPAQTLVRGYLIHDGEGNLGDYAEIQRIT